MTIGNTSVMTWDFFVSYAQADRTWAEWIAWQLEDAGHTVLFQGWDFVPGTNWIQKMQDGVTHSQRVVAVLSPDYVTSVFGAAEWQAIWAHDPTGAHRRVIPVRVADCPRPGLLTGIVGIDLFGIPEAEATQRLHEAAVGALAGRAKPQTAPAFPGQTVRLLPGQSGIHDRPPLAPSPPPGYTSPPAHRPSFPDDAAAVDARNVQGLQIGSGNTQYNYFADPYPTDRQPPVASQPGRPDRVDIAEPLTYLPLASPVPVAWRSDFDTAARQSGASWPELEVHVVPIGAARRSARIMADLADTLPDRLRDTRTVDARQALDPRHTIDAVVVTLSPAQNRSNGWDQARQPQLLGVRAAADSQASAWATLPGDNLGSILDPEHLPHQIAGLLRLIGQLHIIDTPQIAIGIGVSSTMALSTGTVGQLPRTRATMGTLSEQPLHVPPDEQVPQTALDTATLDAAATLTRTLLHALKNHR